MKPLAIIVLISGIMNNVYGDWHSYNSRLSISNESKKYKIHHFHDCLSGFGSYWEETEQEFPINPFLDRTGIHFGWYSYIELIEKESGKTLFKIAAPILTHILIDEEQRVIIGLSEVRLRNPYNLVLWDFDGIPIHAMNLRDSTINCPKSESVTNFFHWYSEKDAEKHTRLIVEDEKIVGLETMSIDKELCVIPFMEPRNPGLLTTRVDYSQMDDNYSRYELYAMLEKIESKKRRSKYLYLSLIFVLALALGVPYLSKSSSNR